jgi:hypothetical protein
MKSKTQNKLSRRPSIATAPKRKDTRSAKDILRTGSEGEPNVTLKAASLEVINERLTLITERLIGVESLARTVDRLEFLIDKLTVKKSEPQDFPQTTPLGEVKQTTQPALPLVTLDDVRKAALAAVSAGQREAVVSILSSLGVSKVSDLKPADFGTFLARLS